MRYVSCILLGAMACLPFQVLADAKKSTPSPSQQESNFGTYWDKMTSEHGGVITKDAWLEQSKKKFEEIDLNGDGKISKDEYMAYRARERAHYLEQKARREHGASDNADKGGHHDPVE